MSEENLTEKTKSHYEELIGDLGEKYLHHRWGDHPVKRSHYKHTKRSVEKAFSELAGAKGSILEIGCGPGTWTDICLHSGSDVTLFDISEEMLKVVTSRFAGNPKLKGAIQGDFVAKPLEADQSYDLIFSARALEYMSDKRAMVEKCFKHIKPGGALAIITKNPKWRDKVLEDGDDPIQTDWVYWKDLAKYYTEAGFVDVVIRPVALGSYYRPYNNFLGIRYCDFLSMVWVGSDMKTGLKDALSESYIVYARKP